MRRHRVSQSGPSQPSPKRRATYTATQLEAHVKLAYQEVILNKYYSTLAEWMRAQPAHCIPDNTFRVHFNRLLENPEAKPPPLGRPVELGEAGEMELLAQLRGLCFILHFLITQLRC